MPLTDYNLSVLNILDPGFAAIVSIRNLPDVAVSYVDHAVAKDFGPLDMRINRLKVMHKGFQDLPREVQHQVVIDHVIPWYSQYLASWFNAAEKRDILFLRYEDVVFNTPETLTIISDYLAKTALTTVFQSNENLKIAANFNKGESGRSRIFTSNQHLQLVWQAQIFRGYNNGLKLFDYLTQI